MEETVMADTVVRPDPIEELKEQTEIRETIKKVLERFVQCNHEIDELKHQLKQQKESKEVLANTIQEFMKQNSIDILSSNGIKIKYVSKETKKQVPKEKLLETVKSKLGPEAFVTFLEELEEFKEISLQESLKIVK